MGRKPGSKNKPKGGADDAKADPSGLRAAGAKLAADDAKKQMKLVVAARDVPVTREEIELPHALSETEVKHASGMAMQAQGELDSLEGEKAAIAKKLAEKTKEITDKRKEVSKLSAEARTGVRRILVGVRIEHDYQASQLRYYRLDRGPVDPDGTRKGELYDTKAMPPEEREKAIFTAPKDAERVVVEPDDAADEDRAADAKQRDEDADDEPAVNAKGGES